MSDQVGVRDLKARLSAYLRRVEGRLNWTGRRLAASRARPKLRGGGATLADIVLRDRG